MATKIADSGAPKGNMALRILALAIVAVFIVLHFAGFALAHENGPMENTQMAILAVATIVYARQVGKSAGLRNYPALSFTLFMVCLPFVGVGREVSFGREFGASPDMVKSIELGFGVVVASLFALSGYVAAFKVSHRWRNFLAILKGEGVRSIGVAVVFYWLSLLFELGPLGFPTSVFMEELCEVVAFMFIVRSAFTALDFEAIHNSP